MITSIYIFFEFMLVYQRWIQGRIKVVLNPASENLGIFVNLCTNSIIKYNFYTSTSDILYPVSYDRLHPPHPKPSDLYTIGQPFLIDIVAIMWLCVMQISWQVTFLCFKDIVTLQFLGDCLRPPASEITTEISSFHKSLNLPGYCSCSGNYSAKILELPLALTNVSSDQLLQGQLLVSQ